MVSISGLVHAAEPPVLTHSVQGCTDNGSSLTLKLTLNITNDSDLVFSDTKISVMPVGHEKYKIFEPIPEQPSIYIGDIPSGCENLVVYCTIQSVFMPPEDAFENSLMLWEIEYIDEMNQVQVLVVESQPASDL